MPRILCIGGTGHVGGAVLHKLLEQHSEDVEIKVLVRDEDKALRLKTAYPQVETIVGDLSQYGLIEAISKEVDLVVNTAPDITHDEGISAILRGLKEHNIQQGQKAYYIHTSGGSLIWDEPEGRENARWWDDIDDIATISALKEKHTHAVTDRLVRNASPDVNVAIISPGFIGGISNSIEHPMPITTPAIMNTARAFGSGFQIGNGDNRHAWIHVEDLANMFLLLANDALAALVGKISPLPKVDFPIWGREAYFFASSEDIRFEDFMRGLVPVLQQYEVIRGNANIESVNVTEAARKSLAGPEGEYDPLSPPPPPDSWAMHIAIMYGVNMRIRSSRMERIGWKAEKGSIVLTFPEIVARFLEQEKADK